MKFKSVLYSCLRSFLPFISKKHLKYLALPAVLCAVLFASDGASDEVNYLYDGAGQLTRVIKTTDAMSYRYDANGNLVGADDGTTSTGSPVIERVTPGTIFIGATTDVIVTGRSLYAVKSVKSADPMLGVRMNAITDTQISTAITVPANTVPGLRTLTVETLYGAASVTVSLSDSRVEFVPDAASIAIGGSGTVNVRITPAASMPLTLWLTNSNPSVVSIPNSVTVPEIGMASIVVRGLAKGSAKIGCCGASASIYAVPAFSLAAGEAAWAASKPVSVFIDSQSLQRSDIVSAPVSVFIGSATIQPASITAPPVSVSIDTAQGNSTVVSTSVSVQIGP